MSSFNGYVRAFASMFKDLRGIKKEKQEIDIGASIDNLRAGFERIFKQRNISFEVKRGPGEFSGIMMYPVSFESVILNLITNSTRALWRVKRDRKAIVFSYEKTQSHLLMRVYDNGYGIRSEDFDSIFGAFWTTHSSAHEKGIGMGLTIVRELVEDEYGGKISVESSTYERDSPGMGETTFIIEIPLENLRAGQSG